MGESLDDMIAFHREERTRRVLERRDNKSRRLDALKASGIPFRMADENTVCIPAWGKAQVTWWPSTGRMQHRPALSSTVEARRFLAWWTDYQAQEVTDHG